jgi:eukaryotic-like serine/threonine-protein kinase
MRNEHQVHYRWRFGTGDFDEAAQRLKIDGVVRPIEPKPARVLSLLLRHAGEMVSKSEFVATIWGNRPTVDNVLATAVGKVRRLLEGTSVSVESIPRQGYRLVGQIERIAVGAQLAETARMAVGDKVPGRPGFVLVEVLASTNGGEVWLASHRSGEKRVYKFASDTDHLSMLKREMTVFRVLEKNLGPRIDIAQILGANFSEAPFYLESEYAGQNLRTWSEAHLRELSSGQRLELVLQIAQVVADAHGVGILHKDIKPDNVLVHPRSEGGWQLKLADFGISRLLLPERLAELGISNIGLTLSLSPSSKSPEGTLFYLAPEVLSGDSPSIRSDVYALGLLLYQCMVADLRRPLAPGWERDIDDSLLASDIAAATDGDPERRIATASQLFERLKSLDQRRLDQARNNDAQNKLKAFEGALQRARARRPWILATICLLSVSLVTSTWLYRNAESGRLAAERFLGSTSAVQRFLAEDIIAQVNPADSRFDPKAGVIGVLGNASSAIDERFSDEPLTQAALHRAVAGAYLGLTDRTSAIDHFKRAIELYSRDLAPDSEPALEARYGLTIALANNGDFIESGLMLKETDRLAEPFLDEPTAIALKSATTWATLERQQMHATTSKAAFERALSLIADGAPADKFQQAELRIGLTEALLRLGEAQQALSLLHELEAEGNEIPVSLRPTTNRNLAWALRSLDRVSEALPYAQKALAQYRELYGPDQFNSIAALSTLSYIHFQLGDCASALTAQNEAYERMRDTFGADRQGTLTELGNRGSTRFECGEQVSGLDDLKSARDALKLNFGPESAPAQEFAYSYARFLGQANRYSEALQALDELRKDVRESAAAGPGSPTGRPKLDLLRARLLFDAGDRQGAIDATNVALTILRTSGKEEALLAEGSTLLQEICKDEPPNSKCAEDNAKGSAILTVP